MYISVHFASLFLFQAIIMIKSIFRILPTIQIQALYFNALCAFLFLCNSTIAQESKMAFETSISKETKLFISQSDSIDQIKELIYDAFDHKKDTVLGLAYCNAFLERGKAQEDYDIQYFASFQMAFITYSQAAYKRTIRHAYSSVKVAEKMKDTFNIISSNTLLGGTWYVLGNYNEALTSYLAAKELATHSKNSPYEIICLTNIANMRTKLNRFEDALNSYNSILKILDEKGEAEASQHLVTYLSSLLGKMLCLAELGRFEEAKATYEKGLALSEANDSQTYKGYFNINLGRVYYEKKEYHTSLGFLKQGKDILLNNEGLKNNLYLADFYIAKNLYKQEKYTEAGSLLDSIFKHIDENPATDRAEEMYQLAIDISKILNDKNKQIQYYDKLQKTLEVRSEKKLLAKDLLYEDDLKEYSIENEKLSNEKNQSLLDKRIILMISIVLFLVLVSFFFFYHRKAKMKEQKFLTIIEEISKSAATQKPPKVSSIQDEKAKIILEKLQKLENTHFYLSADVTLHTTAKLLSTNTTYLSKALNAVKKQSFNQYLNKLRIDYVLVKLKEDSLFRSYTIHAISKEIGYKSATTFIKEFKNKTGLNPSYYIKKIEE